VLKDEIKAIEDDLLTSRPKWFNYVANGSASNDTAGWSTYADAAGTTPVDGTGGSPNVTWTRSTSSPLRGLASFVLTKDAANRQGQGVSYDFTIDTADKAKPLYVSFTYLPDTNYADDDIRVWLYDVTNAVLIQPAPYLLKDVLNAEKWSGVFQTASNSTSYRLIVHIGSTNASAYTVKFDDLRISPEYAVMGSPVTDWQSYTPVWTAASTNPVLNNGTIAGKWRRVGDSVEIAVELQAGSTTTYGSGAPYYISIPPGLTVADSSRLGTQNATVGIAHIRDGGINGYTVTVTSSPGASTVYLFVDNTDGSWNTTSPFTFGNSDSMRLRATVPVAGWSSSVLMSDNADTRVVAASATLITANQSIVNNTSTPVLFNRIDVDTHGAYNSSNGRYTAPVSGIYSVSATLYWVQDSFADTGFTSVELWKNGSRYSILDAWDQVGPTESRAFSNSGSTVLSLNAGDYISIIAYQANNGGTRNLSSVNGTGTFFSIQRLSGPSQIAATETVAARAYMSTATQSIPNSTVTKIALNTVNFDSHGGWDTVNNRWTAPVSGYYAINGSIRFQPTSSTGAREIYLRKNGVSGTFAIATIPGNTVDNNIVAARDVIQMYAGDYIELYGRQSSGGALNAEGSTNETYISLHRI
jgi:hypothetical protein